MIFTIFLFVTLHLDMLTPIRGFRSNNSKPVHYLCIHASFFYQQIAEKDMYCPHYSSIFLPFYNFSRDHVRSTLGIILTFCPPRLPSHQDILYSGYFLAVFFFHPHPPPPPFTPQRKKDKKLLHKGETRAGKPAGRSRYEFFVGALYKALHCRAMKEFM